MIKTAISNIKSAFNKNKLAFVFFGLSLCLLLFCWLVSIFPNIEEIDYGWGEVYYYYETVYTFSIYDLAFLVASSLSLIFTCFIDDAKMQRFIKLFALFTIAIVLLSDFLPILLCELSVNDDLILTGGNMFFFISLFFYLCVIALFIIGSFKKLPKMYTFISLLCLLVAFCLDLSKAIIVMIEYYHSQYLFSLFTSFALPLYFLGLTFSDKTNQLFVNKTFDNNAEKLLYSLKVKYEIGSLTKEEYEAEKEKVLNNNI